MPVLVSHNGSGVAVVSFNRGFVITLHLPCDLAYAFFESHEPGITFAHQCHNDMFLSQHGGGAEVPKQSVLSVVCQVLFPYRFTFQCHCSKVAALEVGKYKLAIGYAAGITA